MVGTILPNTIGSLNYPAIQIGTTTFTAMIGIIAPAASCPIQAIHKDYLHFSCLARLQATPTTTSLITATMVLPGPVTLQKIEQEVVGQLHMGTVVLEIPTVI